jgi:hypothetical protein
VTYGGNFSTRLELPQVQRSEADRRSSLKIGPPELSRQRRRFAVDGGGLSVRG